MVGADKVSRDPGDEAAGGETRVQSGAPPVSGVAAALRRSGVPGRIALLGLATLIAVGAAWYRAGDFAFLWLTADQSGRLAFERRDFAAASDLFEDPTWAGVAGYSAGRYLDAAAEFALVPSAVGSFNRGVALLKGRDYDPAIAAFEQAVKQAPEMEAARHNLLLARYILEYLEDLREQSDTGDDRELSADEFKFDNKRNRGLDMVFTNTSQLEEKSAEQWMRSVDTRMSDYLRIRFLVESSGREAP